MRQATSLSNVDTIFSADAIEFCPGNPHLFACGTYQIQKEESNSTEVGPDAKPSTSGSGSDEETSAETASPKVTRYGRCLIYEIDGEGRSLRERQRFDGPAILDMKWSPQTWIDRQQLAIADAKGHVQLHGLNADTGLLSPTQTVTCADETTLCLSLDWSTRRPSSNPASIVVSLSSGSVCTLGGESELSVTSTWHAHDFEPWIAAFDCWDPNFVWTGGDDLKMKGWDLRMGCDTPAWTNKRSFEGGVTTIQSHPTLENIFAVGSYDSKLRLFDRRKPLIPLTEFDCGGGIWRVKWHATRPERVLVAAMHDGFKVVDFYGLSGGNVEGGGRLHARFDGHESLAYGVDWSGGHNSKGEDIVASCSFYDHSLHVWSA